VVTERLTQIRHAERTPDRPAIVMGGSGEVVSYARPEILIRTQRSPD
jgi:hypothetical protein